MCENIVCIIKIYDIIIKNRNILKRLLHILVLNILFDVKEVNCMGKCFRRILFVFLFVIISIFGMVGVYAENKNIEVTDIKVKDKSGTITVDNPTISNSEINSGIKFNEIDDFVTFELTLKNNDSDKYKVISIIDNNENDNVKIECF